MDSLFPFGFPWQTSLYLTLFVGTLVLHVVLMNYVIAGTAVLAWQGIVSRNVDQRPAGALLRDWMPFAVGGAITAGVAPLLFIQILYQQRFYTANLLLFHRWMMILPALIVGFYFLYLYKSQWLDRRPVAVRMVIGFITLVCFSFVGYSWTENHLLALSDQQTWTEFYATGRIFYFESSLIPRLLVWFFGAFPTMWMLMGWQLRRLQMKLPSDTGENSNGVLESAVAVGGVGKSTYPFSADEISAESSQIGLRALGALGVTLLAAGWYLATLTTEVRDPLFGRLASLYLVSAILGFFLQAIGWWRIWRTGSMLRGNLRWVTTGVMLFLVSMTVMRESIRLAHIELEPLFIQHAESAKVGGIWVFLVFLLINSAIIGLCLRAIGREMKCQ